MDPPESFQKMDLNDFTNIRVLGKGGFGEVRQCSYKPTNQHYALKYIDKTDIKQDDKAIEKFKRQIMLEISIMYQLEHPNLVNIYYHFETSKHIILVLELCNGNSLFKRTFKKCQTLLNVRRWVYQVVKGLDYLHAHNIIHRDLKPENILIQYDNDDVESKASGNFVLKICDFGWATFYENESRKTMCGTREYICPEILTKSSYDMSVDIWTIGVFTYELLEGREPFKETTPLRTYEKMRAMSYPFRTTVDKDVIAFIHSCLQFDPKKRPKTQDLLKGNFLKELYEKDSYYKNAKKIENKIMGNQIYNDLNEKGMEIEDEVLLQNLKSMKVMNAKQHLTTAAKFDEVEKQMRYSVREFMDLKYEKASMIPIDYEYLKPLQLDKEFEQNLKYDDSIVQKYDSDIKNLDEKVNKKKNEILSKINDLNMKTYENLNKNNLMEFKEQFRNELLNINADLKNRYKNSSDKLLDKLKNSYRFETEEKNFLADLGNSLKKVRKPGVSLDESELLKLKTDLQNKINEKKKMKFYKNKTELGKGMLKITNTIQNYLK